MPTEIREKHQKNKDFVVNIPGKGILKKLWICAKAFDYEVSEFEKAGLTEEKSKNVKSPKIKECIAHFECRLKDIIRTGDHVLVTGKIVEASVRDDLYNGKYNIKKAKPLMHIGGPDFGIVSEIINP